ncbi:hypothetical protein RMCBS344292_13080 [Rhizopus microsporus]|nr:hypothetical protein RMCBS344292_13080 [Rhizopus microsporus]
MNITQEQAVCMFFGEEFNKVNKPVLVKRTDKMKDIDVYYIDDPIDPALVSLRKINIYPFRYRRYLSIPKETSHITDAPQAQLLSETMIITFFGRNFFTGQPM